MLSSLIALLFTSAFFFLRRFGYVASVCRMTLFTLQRLSYTTPTFSTSIDNLSLKWHWPRRKSPHWLIITCNKLEYKDPGSYMSLDRGVVKVWFFPTYFRVTAGPWIEARLEGFTIHVTTSKRIPGHIDNLKKNILHSVVNGETIRLHELKAKIILGEASGEDHPAEDVGKAGANDIEMHNEVRICMSTSQWHILAPWSSRMYSYNELVAEVRRNWMADRGSLVLSAKDCRWTKIRDCQVDKGRLSRSSYALSFFRTLCSVPSTVIQIYSDPLMMVDIHVVRSDILFSEFRLRDAELLKEAASKAKMEYIRHDQRHPGLMENIAWDLFVNEVLSVLKR